MVSMLIETERCNAGTEVVGMAFSVTALRLIDTAMADGGISAAVLDINLEGQPVWLVADTLKELGVPFLFEAG